MKILFISKPFNPFLSSFNSWAIPQVYENGFIMPLGWEEELTKRGIEFEVIDMEEETPTEPQEEPLT